MHRYGARGRLLTACFTRSIDRLLHPQERRAQALQARLAIGDAGAQSRQHALSRLSPNLLHSPLRARPAAACEQSPHRLPSPAASQRRSCTPDAHHGLAVPPPPPSSLIPRRALPAPPSPDRLAAALCTHAATNWRVVIGGCGDDSDVGCATAEGKVAMVPDAVDTWTSDSDTVPHRAQALPHTYPPLHSPAAPSTSRQSLSSPVRACMGPPLRVPARSPIAAGAGNAPTTSPPTAALVCPLASQAESPMRGWFAGEPLRELMRELACPDAGADPAGGGGGLLPQAPEPTAPSQPAAAEPAAAVDMQAAADAGERKDEGDGLAPSKRRLCFAR